ncbi:MAG: hypothetical protein KBG28_03585 [Kofleriaceae bacterium]|nr:hypothetical protein [Kofleriaceae bacterium]
MSATIHLSIAASPGTRVSLGPVDLRDFAQELHARTPLRTLTPISAGSAAGPVEVTFALVSAPDDVAVAVGEAFAAIGVTSGSFELAMSEHDAADVELETPPFFEHTLTLGKRTTPTPATVSIDLYTLGDGGDDDDEVEPTPRGVQVTDQARGELEAALRARASWPIEHVVTIAPPPGSGVRVLSSVPADQVPALATLVAAVDATLAAITFPPVLRRVFGAYVDTWDHTLFRHER